MSRHIVWPLLAVLPIAGLRDHFGHPAFQVTQDSRIGILLNDKTRGGVKNEDRAYTLRNFTVGNSGTHVIVDQIKSCPIGRNRDVYLPLPHAVGVKLTTKLSKRFEQFFGLELQMMNISHHQGKLIFVIIKNTP